MRPLLVIAVLFTAVATRTLGAEPSLPKIPSSLKKTADAESLKAFPANEANRSLVGFKHSSETGTVLPLTCTL